MILWPLKRLCGLTPHPLLTPEGFSGFGRRMTLGALRLELKIDLLAYRPLLREQPVWILIRHQPGFASATSISSVSERAPEVALAFRTSAFGMRPRTTSVSAPRKRPSCRAIVSAS